MGMGKVARFWSRVHPDHLLAILRIALGVVFVIGGFKLVLTPWIGVPDAQALVAQYTDPATGYISPLFATKITETLGLSIGTFLLIMGVMEITLGVMLGVGIFTPMVAVQMGLMLWAFTAANPVVGAIRLSRDLALMGLCFAVALAGAGAWSLDGYWRRLPPLVRGRRNVVLVIVRLSLAYPLLASAIFSGGVFENPLNTTLPGGIVFLLGLLLAAGLLARWVSLLLALWMLYLLPAHVAAEGLFLGLNEVKREIGLLAASLVYAGWGPDRWTWPSPQPLTCRSVVDFILAYLEDTLPRPEREAFEAHLADCVKCWRFLKTYRETVSLGQELREEVIPPDVRDRLEAFARNRFPHSS